jgi:predicted RND superfamily exporter protein/outer membrane lipoprotein-sorting protein
MKKTTIRYLWAAVACTLLWSIYHLFSLRTEYSVDQFYPKDHSLLKFHDEIRHQFRLNEESPYLFVVQVNEKDAWINKDRIKKLQDFTSAIEARDDVKQILSMTHVEGASSTSEEMVIGNLFDRIPQKQWKEAILSNSLLYPLLITEDLTSTLIAIESKEKNKELLEKFEASMTKELSRLFPEAKVYSAGVPLLQTRLSNMIQDELSIFLLYTSLAFCLVFYLLFSHWTAIACAFITLVSSNIFALALMSAFKIPMNAILVTLPVIVSVSIMSLLIHTLHLWSSKSGEDALETMKEIWLPNALGILTTALGFVALAPSPIPLIAEYGWAVAFILSFVAIMGQLITFLLLPYVTPKMRAWFDRPAKWALWSLSNPKKIISFIAVLTLTGTLMLTKLNFSLRLFDDLPKGDDVRTTTEWIDKAFGGILTYELKAVSSKEGYWKTPHALRLLDTLTQALRKENGIGTVVTISDFFQGDISEQEAVISETFFLFSMAEKNPLNSFMSEDGKSLRLAIRLTDRPSAELERTKRRILNKAKAFFPEIIFTEGGMANYAHAINQEVAKALIFDFWQPLLLIGIFLIFMFRSFKWAILSCLPNFIPPAVLIGALAITQVPVKPGIALIFSIALGFAFNNTLYLLTRLRSLTMTNEPEPLKKALLMEANPCLFESLVMFTGFSIFLNSEFDMNQTFGGFMLISIVAGFVADLIFLPAFLKMFPQTYMFKKVVPVPVKAVKGKSKIYITGLALILSSNSYAGPDAKEILKKSQALLDAKDDEAMVDMKIIEQNGEAKMRSLTLKTLRDAGFSVMAKIQSPADIKDMAFLGNVDEEGNEKQWIYLPSSGQVRRLVTGKTKAGLLGSEISPEDLNSEAIKSSSVKLQKTDEKFYWIELTPSPDSSEYSKVITKISKDDMLPKFTAYYIKEKLKKTVSFKDYKKIGPVFRAQFMNVQNHMNGRSTEVKLSSIKVNTGLKADDFSQSNLKE